MKVLIAVHGFPPTHCAGAERQAERTAVWLVQNGYEVEVFAIESASSEEVRLTTTNDGRFPVHRLYYDVKQGPDPLRNLYDSPIVGKAIRTVLSSGGFDVVHVMSGYLLGVQAVEAAHEFGIPVVLTLTEYWFMCKQLNLIQPSGRLCSGPDTDWKCARCALEEKRRFRLPAKAAPRLMDLVWRGLVRFPFAVRSADAARQRRECLQLALAGADGVICLSQFSMRMHRQFGYSTERFRFIRQGLPLPTLPLQTRSGSPRQNLRLGYLGQVKFHKGVDLLIEAVLGLLEEGFRLRLDVWDAGITESRYKRSLKQISAARREIHWNERCDGEEVWEALSQIDVLVMPSRWYENSPNVILEAHAAGVVVVCTDLGGMAELVRNEEWGLTFRPNDALHLQSQLRRLLMHRGLLEMLRSNLPSVRSVDEEMKEVVEMYHDVVGRRALQLSAS